MLFDGYVRKGEVYTLERTSGNEKMPLIFTTLLEGSLCR
jgi:hypothetical protein